MLERAARDGVTTAVRTLAYRSRADLPMNPHAVPDNAILLPDTTIYIDGLKRAGLPVAIQALLANRPIRHSPICVGELVFGFGGLDPGHPGTARNRSAIADILDRLPTESFVDVSPAGWAKAGALAGSLSRLQGFAHDRRRTLVLDAALFVTAQEHGLTLVSANLRDMDLLLQAGGDANVLLYAIEPAGQPDARPP